MTSSDDCPNDWRPIPGCPHYDVAADGRVRSWKAGRNRRTGEIRRAAAPRVMQGSDWRGVHHYHIGGKYYMAQDLVAEAWGDQAAERYVADRERTLTDYERREIIAAEGYKPALRVAEEFRISPYRVRMLWDGLGGGMDGLEGLDGLEEPEDLIR